MSLSRWNEGSDSDQVTGLNWDNRLVGHRKILAVQLAKLPRYGREGAVEVRPFTAKKRLSVSEPYRWSVEKPTEFWSVMWEYAGIISSKKFEAVVDDLGRFPGANWFSGARLNFAENLLRFRDERIAFVSRSEGRERSSLTYSDLYRRVARVASGLRETGVRAGDRVGGYLPNIEEAAIAMLASTSVGAVWACCGAELGSSAVLDRLGQITQKVLFAVDGYVYKGKKFDISSNIKDVADGIPSLEKIVTVPQLEVESGVGQ